MLNNIIDSIGAFLTGGGDPEDIRSSVLGALPEQEIPEPEEPEAPEVLRQPVIPEVIKFNEPDEFQLPEIEDPGTGKTNLEMFQPIDVRSPETIRSDSDRMADDAVIAIQDIREERLGLTKNRGQASTDYLQYLKSQENPNNKGRVNVGGQPKYMMFKSVEEKKEKGQSEYEIGYGVKVLDKWLTDKKENWPVIDGVPVNVKEGLTSNQVDSLVNDKLKDYREASKKSLVQWDEMTEEEKYAWTDLSYNGGKGAIRMNKKAKLAADVGYTMEGLVKIFDFTKAGSQRYHGLLKRRLNAYNKAALSVTGAPVVEEYKWGEEVWVKFSSSLRSDKFSKAFRDKINKAGGWYKVPGKGGTPKHVKVGENFLF